MDFIIRVPNTRDRRRMYTAVDLLRSGILLRREGAPPQQYTTVEAPSLSNFSLPSIEDGASAAVYSCGGRHLRSRIQLWRTAPPQPYPPADLPNASIVRTHIMKSIVPRTGVARLELRKIFGTFVNAWIAPKHDPTIFRTI